MHHKLIILLLTVSLYGCDLATEMTQLNLANQEKIWAFIQFNVPEEGDQIATYYYYGEIFKSLYDKIIQDSEITEQFILLQNVKYWGDNDLIYDYKDGENQGDLLFRIDDIRRLKIVNKAPVAGQGIEQFDPVVPQENTDKTE